ncbi:MAG: tyrosine-type recombinase/integrase [Hydrogenothermaceae bacterium]|nr:tyrosine-type recombinase/integrase [Hydrogenothermaceae bacterium]
MKISECKELFLSYIQDKSVNTLKNYDVDLKQFIQIVGDKNISDISKADVAKFRMILQSKNKKSSTIARKLASLNSFFQYLIDIELISVSPITKSHRPKISQKIPSSLSNEEVRKLLGSITDKTLRTIIILLISTGLRSSEILSIKKDSITVERDGKTFGVDTLIKEGVSEGDIAFIRVKGKGDKEREIPITGKPLEILIDYLKTHDFDTVFPISYHLLWRKIRETGRKLGIDIHPHKLRHTAATMALQAGAELRVIQELLGHASPITTARYAKVGQKQLLKATKVLAEKIDL